MTTLETTQQEQPLVALPGEDLAGKLAEIFQEPSWLAALRQSAWQIYRDAPLPDRAAHLWRYTDPKLFLLPEGRILPSVAGEGETAREIRNCFEGSRHGAEAISQNGQIVDLGMDPELQAQGVILTDLHEAARRYPDRVERWLGQIVGASHGKFEALNAALWQGGIYLEIPQGVAIKNPIHLAITSDGEVPFLASRLLTVVGKGAEVTLVDEYSSARSAELSANVVVELAVGAGARLRYVTVQRWGEKVKTHIAQRAHLERDANLLSVWAGLGGSTVKADLGSILAGRGANVRLRGMSFAQHRQHFDQHTLHEHRHGDTFSDLDFKIVLRDRARSVYTGLIQIDQKARNCEAYQENRNLLLSEQARADTIPELEIMNDEVKCSHGATLGPVDEEMLYYLAARGIPREEGIRVIVSGFVEPTIQGMPEDLQERLREYVLERVRTL